MSLIIQREYKPCIEKELEALLKLLVDSCAPCAHTDALTRHTHAGVSYSDSSSVQLPIVVDDGFDSPYPNKPYRAVTNPMRPYKRAR